MISNRMSKAYSEWKSNQDTQPFNENIEKEYQKLLETLSPEQEEVLTKYCDEIFASGAETEEFFYRLGIKDGLRLKKYGKICIRNDVVKTKTYFRTTSSGKSVGCADLCTAI